MMKLHWSPKSPYVRKVMIVGHELKLLDQIELVRSVAAMTRPNERLMIDNPLSKIPTLVLDDGTALFDSVVIAEYLNDRAQGALFPQHGAQRWQSLRWHAFANGLIDMLVLWRNERDRPVPLETLVTAFDCKVRASLQRLEMEATALRASAFCIGQITVLCALGYMDYRFRDLGWRDIAPALARWHAEMSTRPSLCNTEPIDG